MDQYIQSLMNHGDCIEGTLRANETGFVKVKREPEKEVLRTIREIIHNPK